MKITAKTGFLRLGDDLISVSEVKMVTGSGSDLEMTVTFASRTQPLIRTTGKEQDRCLLRSGS